MPALSAIVSAVPGTTVPDVPSWCYRKGPRTCPCGHHEGYHNDAGVCHLKHKCKCIGQPAESLTPNDEL